VAKYTYICHKIILLMNSFTDIQSFNKLFNEYYERFIHFAVGYVKEKEMAEDFVSEAFTIYWENQKKLLPNTKPQAYILTIVKNKCLNHLEHLKVKQRTVNMLSDHESWRLSVSINTLQACDPDFLFSAEIMQIVDE